MKKLILTIDNSSLSAYKLCPEKFNLGYINAYSQESKREAADFGQIIHNAAAIFDIHNKQHANTEQCKKELEALLDVTNPPDTEVECKLCKALTSIKVEFAKHPLLSANIDRYSLKHALQLFWALAEWQDFNPNSRFANLDPPIVETFIKAKLYESPTLDIIYCGYVDKAAVDKTFNLKTILDYKTTGWFNHFDDNARISDQLTGYIWLAQQNGLDIWDCALVGINTRYYKTKPIDTSMIQTVSTRRQQWQIDEWKQGVIDWGQQIANAHTKGNFNQNKNACFEFNTRCEFFNLCHSEPQDREVILKNMGRSEWGGFKLEEKGE